MSTGAVVILVVVVVLVLAAGAWFVAQQARRRRLRERFGPEYDRRIQESDDRRVAERELAEREKRHQKYDLKPISDADRARYTEQWTFVQEQFVDQPGEAVGAAEQLVVMVMRERGYPTGNFEQQTADLSVEHAHVLDNYRSGHAIRTRHEQAGVSTEELRQALTHYREMFHALLGHRDAADAQADAEASRAYHAGRTDADLSHPDGEHVVTNDPPRTVHNEHTANGQEAVEQPRRTTS
jgi:hypothetical protein